MITNLPYYKVWVRKEYLRDHIDGHGEFVSGVWICAKSLPGRAFYFETYLPTYGAMYDKLPISAFLSSPESPWPDLPLNELQFWNCMDYDVTSIVKMGVSSARWEIRTRDHGNIPGEYMCTLDNYHASERPDTGTSELPDEHKSFNLIALHNGQFALYPNNRCRIYDTSLSGEQLQVPDFKVSTKYYSVENGIGFGDTDDYFY